MAEKILIVDDDLDTLRLVGLMLQKQGYQIVVATNGPQGLIQAENENPDLIILDIMMPEMDGYEVARRLRSNPDTADIPILMFTAKAQLDDKVTGFEAGADDYLTKPTHPSELQAHVRALLARSTRKRPAASAATGEKRAFVAGVLAARGGWGVTTVAANLGCSLMQVTQAEVIIAELRPGQGALGPELGKENPEALTKILQASPADITRQMVREQLFPLENGPSFLFASLHPKEAILSGASAQIETLLNRLIYLAPYVILDLGSSLPASTQKLVKACQGVVVVIEPVENSVTHAKALITDLVSLGIRPEQVLPIVVNRIRSELQMNRMQVQERLGQPVKAAITPAPELLYQASRLKTTAVLHQPDSLMAQQFGELTRAVLELEKSLA